MQRPRTQQVSSFAIIKGSLIEETYKAFLAWDLQCGKTINLAALRSCNPIGAKSENWLRDVVKVLRGRYDPSDSDRPLVELAQRGCPREIWQPLLLWHMTRREFLLRDFLVNWLFDRFANGIHRLRVEDLVPYIDALPAKGVTSTSQWSPTTASRVASGLLRIATDFGLLRGTATRDFASYHLPKDSFLYLVHAIAEREPNAVRMVQCADWRMYLMHPDDVERELLRLHQYHELEYDVAGTIAHLTLPCASAADFAGRICV